MFSDRRDAGRRLADRLLGLRREDPVIVSLPYGALQVADEIADRLQAPLRLLLARRVQSHGPAPKVLGAVSEHGAVSVRKDADVSESDLQEQVALESVELYRRSSILRRWAPPVAVVRRTVVLVDDGSSRPRVVDAALLALRAERPGRIVLATPLASDASLDRYRGHVNDVVVLHKLPDPVVAADHYESFEPIGDDAVGEMLRERGM